MSKGIPIKDVSLVTHSGSDHYDDWKTYTLAVGDVEIRLDDKMAERVMLAAGIGEVVWEIDWKKVGEPHAHRDAIVPRVREFTKGDFGIYASQKAAEQAVAKEIEKRIAALKKLSPL